MCRSCKETYNYEINNEIMNEIYEKYGIDQKRAHLHNNIVENIRSLFVKKYNDNVVKIRKLIMCEFFRYSYDTRTDSDLRSVAELPLKKSSSE